MRNTTQTQTVIRELSRLEHATNSQLWGAVKGHLPDISLPSLHRTTSRLADEGRIGASLSVGGQTVLDVSPHPHSHFICSDCDTVKDIDIDSSFVKDLQDQIGGKIVADSLVLYGSCSKCE